MKKIFAVVLLSLLLAGCSLAQSKFAMKGVWELGGDIGFISATPVSGGTTGTATSYFILEPFGGYFVIDNLEIGLMPQFVSVSSSGSTSSLLNIFVDPAYYFPLSNKSIYPFIHALAGYSSESSKGSPTYSGFSWGVGIGAKVEVGGSSLIGLGIDYVQYTFNPSGSSTRNGANNIQILVGFTTFIK